MTGSLVIAMDTTGSMSEEIAAARESAKLLAEELYEAEEPPINFVLSPFNDPSVGPLLVITSLYSYQTTSITVTLEYQLMPAQNR
jgi:hypothetical protein